MAHQETRREVGLAIGNICRGVYDTESVNVSETVLSMVFDQARFQPSCCIHYKSNGGDYIIGLQ